MARSAHAYVRGNTVKFYEWLETAEAAKLPQGPPIWICGDCHVGNLGPIADTEGLIDFEIRDLDRTVIGNPAHDLIRLGLSLATAARGSDLPGVTTAHMLEEMTLGYEEAPAEEDPEFRSRRPNCVRAVMRRAVGRTRENLARERIADVRPTIPLGKRFWPLSTEERAKIERIFATEEVRRLRHRAALSQERRTCRGTRCCLLDEGVQLTREAALRGVAGRREGSGEERRLLQYGH